MGTFTVTVTCASQTATATVTVEVLSHPENLTATAEGNVVTLEWDAVETAEYYWYDGEFGAVIEWDRMETSLSLTEYKVYRSKDNVNYEFIGNLVDVPSMNHFQYSDMNNKVGTAYYKVTAYYADEDCESEYGLAADSTDDFVMVDITTIN